MTRLVGLDVGTSSVKGVAVDETGAVVGRASRAHPSSHPRPGWSEQDPEDWVAGAQAVLAQLARADAVGLSGQMHGLVALDAADRVLRPAILWNDGRTQGEADAIEARLGRSRLVALTGNRALAGFTAPKLLWLREHEPDTYARMRSVLLPKDYVRLRLSGERATDVADASGTLLFDVAARRWSDELLGALDVDSALLPAVHESPSPTGETAEGAVVAAGAGDQAAGALGVGVVDAGDAASLVLGTSGVVFTAQDKYRADPEGRLHAFCHAVPGRWHVMGVTLAAAGSIAWLHGVVGGEYGQLDVEAARWAPGAEGLLFAPYLAGERTPHADADARGAFVGLGLRHDRGALTRAVLEGVAFSLADALDLVSEVGGRPPIGRVSGGGAASALWLEIVASVLDLPLEVTVVDDGAAYGAALLAGVAVGAFADAVDAVRRCVTVTRTIEPRPDWVARYAELRPRFRALYPTLARLP